MGGQDGSNTQSGVTAWVGVSNNNNRRNGSAGYLVEKRRRILKERHIRMRKPYQLPGWTKNSSYYSAPVGDQTHDLPPP